MPEIRHKLMQEQAKLAKYVDSRVEDQPLGSAAVSEFGESAKGGADMDKSQVKAMREAMVPPSRPLFALFF